MSGVTLVFVGEEPSAPVRWHIVSDGGELRQSGNGDWSALGQVQRGKTVLVVKGAAVTSHIIKLAAKTERQAREAAPFAVEDLIASDVDSVHVALQPSPTSSREAAGERSVLVADLTDVSDWLSTAREAGIDVSALFPDYWLLPSEDTTLTRCSFGDSVLLRAKDWGASLDASLAGELEHAIAIQRGESLSDPGLTEPEILIAMASRARDLGAGLLTGRFTAKQRSADGAARLPWRSAVAAAVALVVLLIAQNLIVGSGLSREADEIRRAAEQQFRALYPETQQIRNLRAQLRERTGEGGTSQPEFLILSAALAQAVSEDPGLDIDFIRFNAETGEMVSSVIYNSYEDFAAFRARVEQRGVRFDEGGSQQAGRRRVGNFSVSVRP